MLTQKDLHNAFNYDPDTGQLMWRINKPNVKKGQIAGNAGNRNVNLGGYSLNVSRVIWCYVHGYWPKRMKNRSGNYTNLRLVNLYDPDL